MDPDADPHDLERFVQAQAGVNDAALGSLSGAALDKARGGRRDARALTWVRAAPLSSAT
jgi:uncharacterized protein (DUF1810 family)